MARAGLGGRGDGADGGAGVVGTVIGVLIFLTLVLFATQVLFGLYTTSVVTAAAYDAAKSVAGADASDAAARADAEVNARHQLGRFGNSVRFDWAVGVDAVRLTVQARRPTILPRALAGGVGLADVVRTVRVRSEVVR